jgi:hypothetical protein
MKESSFLFGNLEMGMLGNGVRKLLYLVDEYFYYIDKIQ